MNTLSGVQQRLEEQAVCPSPLVVSPNHSPPVVILGGGANALSIARSLGRGGVKVYAINDRQAYVRYSRYAQPLDIPGRGSPAIKWASYLLGPESEFLRGAVLLAASDQGIEIIVRHRELLKRKYLLDASNPQAQMCMLNKLQTYRAAVKAGVPTPRFWLATTREEVAALRNELVFPLIVKPQLSHLFEERFGAKFLVAENFDELHGALTKVAETGIEMLLMEKIPGPDDRLCSYYTYLDNEGNALFDFTKRVIRRFPINMGGACYHVTDQNPMVQELSLRLFRYVGLRGLANAEFKLDQRDGQLKLIECNARFTAANCLVADAGLDLAKFVYNRITGRPQTPMTSYRSGARLWYPIEDFKAFRELHRRGEMSWRQWLRSIAHKQSLPFFRWHDPLPTLVGEWRRVQRMIGRPFSKSK